jgi:hypothetical protein
MKIAAHEQRMSISPYPQTGQIGHFTPQRVWIEDAAGKISGQLENPLSSFAGHTLTTPWDQLQTLYFFSYAFRYYLATHSRFWSPLAVEGDLSPSKWRARSIHPEIPV